MVAEEPSKSAVDEDLAEPSVRAVGHMKWFDAEKGYGFLVCAGSDLAALAGAEPAPEATDVLLHVSCLRKAGLPPPPEGASVTCEVVRRPRGYQVLRLMTIEAAEGLASAAPEPAEAALPACLVQVKWYNGVKGFGFVRRIDAPAGHPAVGEDVFLHAVALRRAGLAEVEPDARLRVDIARGPKGWQVCHVHVGASDLEVGQTEGEG
jgi:CspA family cold shock protein